VRRMKEIKKRAEISDIQKRKTIWKIKPVSM
jgi:hypothetical protein